MSGGRSSTVEPAQTDKQKALEAIEGLTIADVLDFFYAKADGRDKQIAELVDTSDELGCDGAIISEGGDNGSFVLCWAWVDFAGTDLDKDVEEEDAPICFAENEI